MDPSTQSLCPHFGECGGCQNQDIPYTEQVKDKVSMLEDLYRDHWTNTIEVTPSPIQWNYRNKIDPSFARKQYPEPPPKDFVRETVIGFKKRGRWFDPLDLQTCHIGPEDLTPFLDAIRAWYTENNIRAYDNRNDDGILRNLLIRVAKHTKERMVVLITRSGDIDLAPFVELVRQHFPAQSVYRGNFDGKADVAIADELILLDGEEHIYEEIHLDDPTAPEVLRFRISPMSFFQTNTLATEKLYGAIREWVKNVAPNNLYDLYGGAGGIAFSCADLVDHIWSVETVLPASEDGRINATNNNIDNVTFITDKVKNYLKWRIEGDGLRENSAVVLDPPRAGLHPKAIRRLIELAPQHVLYVSCNPKILARELEVLTQHYDLKDIQGFDLFPHTRHVEVVAELVRR